MTKRTLAVIAVILVAIILLFSVFLGQQSGINVSLDKVSLTIDDFKDEGYEEFDKEHITEPYTAPSYTLFSGWKILEKYGVRFSKNDTCYIVLNLGKLTSKDKCKEFISKINDTVFLYDFEEVEPETIGQETYFGVNITTYSEENATVYFVVFRIENVVVALLSSGIPKEKVIDYSKIIESRIYNNLD